MNEKPGCPGTAAKLPYSPGNQKLTPPSSAHELFVDNKTEITNRNALNKRRTLDATTRMRLIVVKTCDAQIPGLMRTPCLLPLREQKGEFCAQLPVWRGVRSYRVVIGGKALIGWSPSLNTRCRAERRQEQAPLSLACRRHARQQPHRLLRARRSLEAGFSWPPKAMPSRFRLPFKDSRL